MKTMEGLATSSTAMVSRFLCSTDRPLMPGTPTCHHTTPTVKHAPNRTKPLSCRAWAKAPTEQCLAPNRAVPTRSRCPISCCGQPQYIVIVKQLHISWPFQAKHWSICTLTSNGLLLDGFKRLISFSALCRSPWLQLPLDQHRSQGFALHALQHATQRKQQQQQQQVQVLKTHQDILKHCQLHKPHDFIHKGLDGLARHALRKPELGTEVQSLSDRGLGRVHVILLYISAHSGKAGLLFGVAVHADVTLNVPA